MAIRAVSPSTSAARPKRHSPVRPPRLPQLGISDRRAAELARAKPVSFLGEVALGSHGETGKTDKCSLRTNLKLSSSGPPESLS
jgi:hypothetical protein